LLEICAWQTTAPAAIKNKQLVFKRIPVIVNANPAAGRSAWGESVLIAGAGRKSP
jgi:hypothetical protein